MKHEHKKLVAKFYVCFGKKILRGQRSKATESKRLKMKPSRSFLPPRKLCQLYAIRGKVFGGKGRGSWNFGGGAERGWAFEWRSSPLCRGVASGKLHLTGGIKFRGGGRRALLFERWGGTFGGEARPPNEVHPPNAPPAPLRLATSRMA